MTYITRAIVPEDVDVAFECRDPEMATFLKSHAISYERQGLARTFIATETASSDRSRIAGFYSICAARIQLADIPATTTVGLPPHPLPMLLLARVARDRFSPSGTGEKLMIDLMHRSLEIAEAIGCWGILLDAKNEALVDYYAGFDFQRTRRSRTPQPMFLSLGTVRDGLATDGSAPTTSH